MTSRILCLFMLAASAGCGEVPVELKTVNLNQLKDAIAAQKGKVVVLDIWADFCVPCKKGFPHLVKLHQDHARDGLVCMSLCVDEPEDKAAALKFLQAKNATFSNFWIDEPAQVWQDYFLVKGIPAVFVYDRDGKQAARFDNDDPDNQFTYPQVESKVQELLKARK